MNRSRLLPPIIVVSLVLIATLAAPSPCARAKAKTTGQCTVTATAAKGVFGRAHAVKIVKACVVADPSGDGGTPSVTLVCGEKGTKADAPLVKVCGGGNGIDEIKACARTVNGTPGLTAPFATAPVVKGKVGKAQRWCPGDVVPALAQGAIRAEAQRLVPRAKIGSAWKDTALVNAEVIFWADTALDRPLPTANVLGQDVRLKIGFRRADWNFGDGHTDATTDPGKVYDHVHHPCRTAQCPHYYGHTYADTGRMTITLTLTWTARFSLDGGASWTDLDPPVTGPTGNHVITVKQARAVLVPNPGD